jgi:type I restriction enzyme M protein
MILHGVHYKKFDLKQEDTLENPQHLEERFEAVVIILIPSFFKMFT